MKTAIFAALAVAFVFAANTGGIHAEGDAWCFELYCETNDEK